MKYSELEELRNSLNRDLKDGDKILCKYQYGVVIYYNYFFNISIEMQYKDISIQTIKGRVFSVNNIYFKFLKACMELAETPIADREDGKYYHYSERR